MFEEGAAVFERERVHSVSGGWGREVSVWWPTFGCTHPQKETTQEEVSPPFHVWTPQVNCLTPLTSARMRSSCSRCFFSVPSTGCASQPTPCRSSSPAHNRWTTSPLFAVELLRVNTFLFL